MKDAEVILAIARELAKLTPDRACAVMAAVCSVLGDFDRARRFIDLAEQHKLVRDLDAAGAH